MGDWIKDKISGFASGIIDGFKSGFGVASPSRITTRIGEFLVLGIGKGIKNEAGGLLRDIDKLTADTVKGLDMSSSIRGMDGFAFGDASPVEYKQVNVYQNVQAAKTLLDVYNNTKFGIRAAGAV